MGTSGDDPKVFEATIQVFVIFTWILSFVPYEKDLKTSLYCRLGTQSKYFFREHVHGATRMAHRRAGVQGCRGAWRTGAQVHMRTGAQVPIKIEHRLKN